MRLRQVVSHCSCSEDARFCRLGLSLPHRLYPSSSSRQAITHNRITILKLISLSLRYAFSPGLRYANPGHQFSLSDAFDIDWILEG